ncbi:MAG: RsmB/NOP family class I SAM-dependent RNA methyltransferase [Rhizobiaceae bacterium]
MSKPGLATRTAATILLTRVVDDGRSLDGLLDTRHGPTQYKELSDADKALSRAIVVTALRHRGEIEIGLSKVLDRKPPKNARHLIHTLHVATAQILHMDVPDSAAVDLAIAALKNDQRSTRFAGLANAVLRRLSREKMDMFSTMSTSEIAVTNMSPWLRKRIRKDYGKERLASIAIQHMLEPIIDLTVKSDPEQWAEKLGGIHLFGNSLRVDRPGRIESWPGFGEGKWWIQDAAASLPVNLFGELSGRTALDLCAAPGGKTAQLASGGAQVTALEASTPRLDRLNSNLQRLNLNAETINADMMEWTSDRLFDAVLLDAPCSSTGTIRRHPDVQWNKSEQIVNELAQLQIDMIIRAAEFVKPGGTLVFANCSIDRAEGEDVYATILSRDIGLEPDPTTAEECFGLAELINRQGTIRSLPCHLQCPAPPAGMKSESRRWTGLDGFFCARFKKADKSA